MNKDNCNNLISIHWRLKKEAKQKAVEICRLS